MRWLKTGGCVVVVALLLSGCNGYGRDKNYPRSTKALPTSPAFNFRGDSRAARKRTEYLNAIQLAGSKLQSGELDEALHTARGARRLQPKDPDAYTLIGAIEEQRGRAVEAGAAYRKALDLAPQRGDVLNNYGAWLCGHGYPAEALVLFDRALRDESYENYADAMANAGGCALSTGQIERAQADLQKALELDPENPYALESMARYEAAHGHWFDARAFYQRRLAAGPPTASLLQLAIEIEQQLGNAQTAALHQQRLQQEFSVTDPAADTTSTSSNTSTMDEPTHAALHADAASPVFEEEQFDLDPTPVDMPTEQLESLP